MVYPNCPFLSNGAASNTRLSQLKKPGAIGGFILLIQKETGPRGDIEITIMSKQKKTESLRFISILQINLNPLGY